MSTESLIPIEQIVNASRVSDVFGLLDRVAQQLQEIQRMTVGQVNLTPPQYQTLRLLWAEDARTLKELAALNFCTPPTMTGIVDTLEKKELVTRLPNPADRRSLLVTLTEHGKTLQGSTPDLDRIYDTCCVGLTSDEFQQLGVLLQKLLQSLDCSC